MTSPVVRPALGAPLWLMAWLAATPAALAQPPETTPRLHQARSDQALVVSVRGDASRIGRDVLREGGNAVDAAVATAFALAVSWPEAGNIGGGGFMMVHPGFGQEPTCVDYRETAPASAAADMFTAADGSHSRKIVGVPGTVRGLEAAHRRFGKLPWRRLVLPAAELAAQGVVVDRHLAGSLNSVLEASPSTDERFEELHRVYGHPDGRAWQSGDRMVLPDLARTLRLIAERGPNVFYRGEIAEALLAEMRRGDGRLAAADLAGYQAKFRQPVHGKFRGYDLWGPPPPSSGGVAVIEALQLLERLEVQRHPRYSAEALHLLAESLRRAFHDRAVHLGDPDFVTIPDHLTDPAYAASLAESVDRLRATPSESLSPDLPLARESDNTTHFSVVDADGMAVSNTYTLEHSWGSRIVVPGAGFVLNNEMGDFNWFPGRTDRQGRIGTEPNLIAPGKRMLSSQSPFLVTQAGRVVLVVGSPGGRTIISTVVNVLLNSLQYEMPLHRAVAAPRLHHQWFPDTLYLEPFLASPYAAESGAETIRQEAREADLVATLQRLGHNVQRRMQGSVHAIAVQYGDSGRVLTGVADFRRGGLAAAVRDGQRLYWDFEGPHATPLAASFDDGPRRTQWSRNLTGAVEDGRGALRLGGQWPQPASSFAAIGAAAGLRLRGELTLREYSPQGEDTGERLWLGFSDRLDPTSTLTVSIRRDSTGSLLVEGPATDVPTEAPPGDGELQLAIEVSPNRERYEVQWREAGQWRILGGGPCPPGWTPRYVVLGAEGDFSQPEDRAAIESIEVLTAAD